MQSPGNLAVHEALFYGGNQQRVVWVYGTLGGGSESSVKLGDKAATLRPQLSGDVLGLPGTLSVDGKATYAGTTTATSSRVNVTRSGGSYTIQALGNVEAVYATDGAAWFRLSGPVTAGQTVLANAVQNTFLRGAGDLTDPEADALGAELKGQGALAVAVLPDSSLPDQALKVEPTLEAGKHPLTGLYVQSGIAQVAATTPQTTPVPPVTTSPVTTSPVTTPPVTTSPGSSASVRNMDATARSFDDCLDFTGPRLLGIAAVPKQGVVKAQTDRRLLRSKARCSTRCGAMHGSRRWRRVRPGSAW